MLFLRRGRITYLGARRTSQGMVLLEDGLITLLITAPNTVRAGMLNSDTIIQYHHPTNEMGFWISTQVSHSIMLSAHTCIFSLAIFIFYFLYQSVSEKTLPQVVGENR